MIKGGSAGAFPSFGSCFYCHPVESSRLSRLFRMKVLTLEAGGVEVQRLNQKDLKSATIQAAPVIRKVRANSDQLKCISG